MKKGFLLSSSSSKVVNERNKNKTSSVILPDDQSQSQQRLDIYERIHGIIPPIVVRPGHLEEDTINKGLSQYVRMPGEMPPDNYGQDGGVQQQYNNDGAGPPDEGTAVVSIQRQRRLDRMSVRRQTTNNYSLAQQHQHQLRQRQQFRQEQNREQNREQHREARAEMTLEQLENRREQNREQHRQARAAEGVQIAEEVNDKGETFSIDMIGRPTANQLEGFEFDEDKALLLWYENAHDHVNDLIQELDDCEIGEGWLWQPLSKRCVCHGGPLACSASPKWHALPRKIYPYP